METTSTTKTAAELDRGDRITFDFAGGSNHLGECDIFDAFPNGPETVRLALITSDTEEYHYRTVANSTPFEVQ